MKPCGRINSAMVVGRDTLYLYGGMMELGDREVTLDDLYTMDLNKLDAWNLVIEVILQLVILARSVLRLASQISHSKLIYKDVGSPSHFHHILWIVSQATKTDWVEVEDDEDDDDDDDDDDKVSISPLYPCRLT